MSWSSAQVMDAIKAQLGAPMRAVELDKSQLESALAQALQAIATYVPNFKFDTFMINAGQQKYDLKQMGKPYGKGLTRLFSEPITSPSAVFNEFEYYRLRQPPYVDMGELLIDNMYYKEIGLLTGTEFDWEWDPDSKVILVTPQPNRTRKGAYEYNAEITKIDQLSSANQDWAFRYSVAVSKEMLARVRGKFQGVPGHDLPINTDWESLLQESKEEKTQLREELMDKARASWTPPIKG